METDFQALVEKIRRDFETVSGSQVNHFYCPILYRDEEVELCKAHIVNEGIKGAPRHWTVQRADVDSFFGSRFEADFVFFENERVGGDVSAVTALSDKRIRALIQPKIRRNGQDVPYYGSQGEVPSEFTEVEILKGEHSVPLVLKMSKESIVNAKDEVWEIDYRKDMRLQTFVSVVKACHLTMFRMLGYRYVLSAAGHFVGKTVLGDFYLEQVRNKKSVVLEAAHEHFVQFQHMVRPVLKLDCQLQGSINDRAFIACESSGSLPWAIIVLLPTGGNLYGALFPANPDTIDTYLRFLGSDVAWIRGSIVSFDPGSGSWQGGESMRMNWTKSGVLLA